MVSLSRNPVSDNRQLPTSAAVCSSRQLPNDLVLLLPFAYTSRDVTSRDDGISNPCTTTRPLNMSLIHPRWTTDSRTISRRHGLTRTASAWCTRSCQRITSYREYHSRYRTTVICAGPGRLHCLCHTTTRLPYLLGHGESFSPNTPPFATTSNGQVATFCLIPSH